MYLNSNISTDVEIAEGADLRDEGATTDVVVARELAVLDDSVLFQDAIRSQQTVDHHSILAALLILNVTRASGRGRGIYDSTMGLRWR